MLTPQAPSRVIATPILSPISDLVSAALCLIQHCTAQDSISLCYHDRHSIYLSTHLSLSLSTPYRPPPYINPYLTLTPSQLHQHDTTPPILLHPLHPPVLHPSHPILASGIASPSGETAHQSARPRRGNHNTTAISPRITTHYHHLLLLALTLSTPHASTGGYEGTPLPHHYPVEDTYHYLCPPHTYWPAWW